MTIGWVLPQAIALLLLSVNGSLANDIYINQVGNNADITIVQEGESNVISSLTGNTRKATI